MAFERSTPMPPMGREPVEKPFIPRGRLAMTVKHVTRRHDDGTVTFDLFSNATDVKATITYHRVPVTSETVCGTALTVLVTPKTVITWDRLP